MIILNYEELIVIEDLISNKIEHEYGLINKYYKYNDELRSKKMKKIDDLTVLKARIITQKRKIECCKETAETVNKFHSNLDGCNK